jgi:hypothetical protein
LNGIRSLAGRAQRKLSRICASAVAQAETELRWTVGRTAARPHGLSAELVVSLTSHAKRFATLAPTLKCLLSQSVRADATVLWIGEADFDRLPRSVLALREHGLEIRRTRDLGPYTKLIPSLRSFPASFIATADDDVCYGPTWLERLVAGHDPARPAVVCHRAHRLRLDARGRPVTYLRWDWEAPERETSPHLVATGVGGVLYFPGALPEEATDEAAFRAVAPRADDLWLYWMERRAGVDVTTLGHRRPLITWLGSQRHGLNRVNVDGATMNDAAVEMLIARYGLPFEAPGMSHAA